MIMSWKLSSQGLTLKASGSTTLPVGAYTKKSSHIVFTVATPAHILFPICIHEVYIILLSK